MGALFRQAAAAGCLHNAGGIMRMCGAYAKANIGNKVVIWHDRQAIIKEI
jgi:hypothetical protein